MHQSKELFVWPDNAAHQAAAPMHLSIPAEAVMRICSRRGTGSGTGLDLPAMCQAQTCSPHLDRCRAYPQQGAEQTLQRSTPSLVPAGGVTVKKTTSAMVIGIYSEGVRPADCTLIVENLGDYLIGQGI